MLAVQEDPQEVTTDRAPALATVIAESLPAAVHDTDQYPNNRMEYDHGKLKARLRSTRGLTTFRSARTIIEGHAFIQNLRRGHYELGLEDGHSRLRVAAASGELARAIDRPGWARRSPGGETTSQRNSALDELGLHRSAAEATPMTRAG